MFSNLFDSKKNTSVSISQLSTSKENNSTTPYNVNQSGLVKLNIEEAEVDKDIDFNENDIDKIEEKIARLKNPELFTRENQISLAVDEIIEVPKKKMKDEINILSDDKKKKRIQNQIREKEKEEDKKERKIEIDKNSKRIKEYNEVLKMKKIKLKKNLCILCVKYFLLIILISSLLIALIIIIDKYR